MASSLLKEMVKKECLNQSQTDNDGSSVVAQTTGQVPKRVDASGAEVSIAQTNIFNYDFVPSTKRSNQMMKPMEARSPLVETQIQLSQNQPTVPYSSISPSMNSLSKDYLVPQCLQHQMFTAQGYNATGQVFSTSMIPPMLVQAPITGPTSIPGVFQPGFMYQTFNEQKAYQGKSHYFAPFTKGSLIVLSNGGVKPIEDLKTTDFIESAKVSKQLYLETCKIAKIQETPNSSITWIAFAVENIEKEVLVEKPSDHPFYVYDQGWASCQPEATFAQYGLQCQKLRVGDVCVFLSNRHDNEKTESNFTNIETKSSVGDEANNGLSNSVFPSSINGKEYGTEQNSAKRSLDMSAATGGGVFKATQFEDQQNTDNELSSPQSRGKKAKIDVIAS